MQDNNMTAGSGPATPYRIPINFFPSVNAQTPRATRQCTPAQIVELLAQPRPWPKKEAAPLVTLVEYASGAKSRKLSDIVRAHAVVGDIDHLDDAAVFEAALAKLKQEGIQVLAYQTYNHKPEAPRWRVVVFLEEPIPPQQYRQCWDGLNALFGGMLDEGAKDCGRLSYVPSCPPGQTREVRTLNIGGDA